MPLHARAPLRRAAAIGSAFWWLAACVAAGGAEANLRATETGTAGDLGAVATAYIDRPGDIRVAIDAAQPLDLGGGGPFPTPSSVEMDCNAGRIRRIDTVQLLGQSTPFGLAPQSTVRNASSCLVQVTARSYDQYVPITASIFARARKRLGRPPRLTDGARAVASSRGVSPTAFTYDSLTRLRDIRVTVTSPEPLTLAGGTVNVTCFRGDREPVAVENLAGRTTPFEVSVVAPVAPGPVCTIYLNASAATQAVSEIEIRMYARRAKR